MSKVYATLSPHRLGPLLELSQGNLVVTATEVCDFHRAAFGSILLGVGNAGFECYFWSTLQASLANLCAVGLAEATSSVSKCVGEESTSFSLITDVGSGNAGFFNNNAMVGSPIQSIAERQCIGVMYYGDPSAPYVSFQLNGNYIGQLALVAGHRYLPAISIGCNAPGDVNGYCNFGQHRLDFSTMFVNV